MTIYPEPARCNCVAWALYMRLRYGGEFRCRQSPVYPMLPRAAWRASKDAPWLRYHLKGVVRVTALRKWIPLHAIWFKGKVIRDL
jgi:hypothetical protein